MPGFRASIRPDIPVLNKASVLARGLKGMIAGPIPRELVYGTLLTGNLTQRPVAGIGGTGFQFNANDQGLRVSAPSWLRLTYPITIAAHVIYTGTPSASASIFGVSFTSPEADPFLAYCLGTDNLNKLELQYNIGGAGSFRQVGETVTVAANTLYSLVATLQSDASGNAQKFYVNGIQSGATGVEAGTISYGAAPLLAGGEFYALGRNPNLVLLDGMIWDRILSANERALLDTQSPWDLYWQPSNRAYSFMSSAAAAAGYLLVKN